MKLNKKDWGKKIKVYYDDELKNDLVEKILSCVDGQCSDENFSLVDKSSGRRVFKLEFDNKSYYIKKYLYRKVSKRIKNLFRSAEAVRAFKKCKQLLASGSSGCQTSTGNYMSP